MSDKRADELQDKVEKLEKEVNRIKNDRESSGKLQNESEKSDSELSRRDFLKGALGGTAAAGAMAMFPSASALDFESTSGFSFGNQTSTNFELGSSGDLNLQGGDLQNAGAANVDKLSVGGDGPAESFSEIGGASGVANAVVTLKGGTPTAYRADGVKITQDGDAGVVIQAALDAGDSARGGRIKIGPGEFQQQTVVDVPSDTVISGAGMGNTLIKATKETYWTTNADKFENVVFRDFTFDGNNQGGNTRMSFNVQPNNPTNCHAVRLQLLNCGQRSTDGTAGGIAFRNPFRCSYINCHVDNTSYVGLSMQKKGRYNRIIGCVVTNPNKSGYFTHPISIESNSQSLIQGCVVDGDTERTGDVAGGPQLNINAAEQCTVTGNTLRNGGTGIHLSNTGNFGVTISGNTIENMTGRSIEVLDTSGGALAENLIVGNVIRNAGDGRPAIRVTNGAQCEIISNAIYNCDTQAIKVTEGDRPSNIMGNVIHKPTGTGIGHGPVSGSSERTFITGNRIYKPDGGRAIECGQSAMISNNCATQGAIVTNGNDSIVLGNHTANRFGLRIGGENSVIAFNVANIDDSSTDSTIQNNIAPP